LNEKTKTVLLLDVGSDAVSGAIVLLSPGKPNILYKTERAVIHPDKARANRLLSQTIDSVSTVLLELAGRNDLFPRSSPLSSFVNEVLIFLSAPWTVSQTESLHLSSQEPVLVTEEILRKLHEEAARERTVPAGMKLIEQKLMRAELNGYPTQEPYGKLAGDISFSLFSGYAAEHALQKMTDAVERSVHPKRVTFHSFSFSAFAALRDGMQERQDFLLLHLGGEQTEVSIVRQGILLESRSFPFGRKHFLRLVRHETKMPASVAETLLTLHAESKSEGRFYGQMKKELHTAQEEWLRHFTESLQSLAEGAFLPRTIFLIADSSVAPVLEKTVQGGDFSTFTVVSGSFEVLLLGAETFGPLLGGNPLSLGDPSINLESLFAGEIRASLA